MGWFSDEILFYGGIAITIAAVIAVILNFLISKIHQMRLNEQLDEEYGKQKKEQGGENVCRE